MIGPALILLGSYLSLSPGVDMFLLPKLVCIFAGALICLARPAKPATLRPYFLILLACTAASCAVSDSPIQSLLGHFLSPTAGLLGMVAIWLSYEAGLTATSRSWPLVTTGAAITALLALIQLLPQAPYHFLIPSGRAIGTIGNPPFLGVMLALSLPLGGAWALPVIVLGLLATRSKAAIIGAVAGVIVRKPKFAWGLIVLIPFVAFAFNRHASDTIRIYLWEIAWKAFCARPWFGWGPDSFTDTFMILRGPEWFEAGAGASWISAGNAHNLILNTLATCGIVGLAARAALAWRAWSLFRAQPPESTWCHADRATLTACYASVLAYSLFNPTPFTAWAVLAYMLGSA